MSWISRVVCNGHELDPDRVAADFTIRHGRDSYDASTTASTCSFTFLAATRAELKQWECGYPLQILDDQGAPVFTGRVSDLAVADDDPDAAASLAFTGAGRAAELGGRQVGENVVWPAEPWAARVGRLLQEGGFAPADYLIQPDAPDYQMGARPADDQGAYPAVDLLAELELLGETVGAAITDTPDGRILVQAAHSRIALPMVTPDPDHVIWSPGWQMVHDVVNVVTIGYLGGGQVTAQDAASIALYGERDEGQIETELQDAIEANRRALERLGRRAYPRWAVPVCMLTRRYPLQVGTQLLIEELPVSAPIGVWMPIVEGWEDHVYVDDQGGEAWAQTVQLSDPMLSGLALLWRQTGPAGRWADLDPATKWRQATTLEALIPGA